MPKSHLQLTAEDRTVLESMLSQRSLTVKMHKRVETLLLLDSGSTFKEVVARVGLTFPTLKLTLQRYLQDGLPGLKDHTRSGRPPRIDGQARAKITALACSPAPQGHARWTLRLLADKVIELGICQTLSHVHTGEILKKTNYSPTANGSGV